jgi:hypothetical protein
MTLEQDIKRVLELLSAREPMSEEMLSRLLNVDGMSEERISNAVNTAHAQNRIRWVAFEGWLKGGRPT